MPFIKELEQVREEHVRMKMKEYQKVENEVLQDAMKQLDVEQLKKDLLSEIKKNPTAYQVKTSYVFSIEKLYESKKKENPLECWYEHRSQAWNYVLMKGNQFNIDSWTQYFIERVEPIVQKIKTVLDDASTAVNIYAEGPTKTMYCKITIWYEMNVLRLPSA